eukprot:scaffold988_cov393-Pavlova_lutheri.AAC.11
MVATSRTFSVRKVSRVDARRCGSKILQTQRTREGRDRCTTCALLVLGMEITSVHDACISGPTLVSFCRLEAANSQRELSFFIHAGAGGGAHCHPGLKRARVSTLHP